MNETEATSSNFKPSLKTVIEKGDCEQLEKLIKKGADVNELDYGMTPLVRAVQKNDEKAIRLLLHGGADVNTRDQEGKTALMFAMENSGANSFALFEAKDSKLPKTVEQNINPYPADPNFRLLRLLPNITNVLYNTSIHTLPTVTKLYATISSCTACQMYQKLRIPVIIYIFFAIFPIIFGPKLLIFH